MTARLLVFVLIFTPALIMGQNPRSASPPAAAGKAAQSPAGAGGAATPANPNAAATKADIDAALDKALNQDNKDQAKEPDFQLSLGIGSLINAASASDYNDQSNVLNSTNLGRSSPQYLVGASFRSRFPNFGGHMSPDCKDGATAKTSAETDEAPCWQQRPWKAFLNLKFSSTASQTLNGYVLGGSYQLLHYMDILIGFGFTPFNEASPGFRVTASQYVTAQQKLGNDLNFNPVAMANGSRNAFDGFSLTDASGALIYKGNPLEVHYRGGLVLGVALPLSLKSAFK